MIRTKSELIETLKQNPANRLHWYMGNRPSDSGLYSIRAGQTFTPVHGNAANAVIKANAVRSIRCDWTNIVYKLISA